MSKRPIYVSVNGNLAVMHAKFAEEYTQEVHRDAYRRLSDYQDVLLLRSLAAGFLFSLILIMIVLCAQ